MLAKIFILAMAFGSISAFADDINAMLKQVIPEHQKCALQKFVELMKTTDHVDPNLNRESVEQCEALLEPLKNLIISKTGDPAMAERLVEKVRRASMRGVGVAAAGVLAKRGIATAQDK